MRRRTRRLVFIPNLITDDEAWRKFLFLGENGSLKTKAKLHMLFEFFPQVRQWIYEEKITHEQLGWLIHRSRESVTRAFMSGCANVAEESSAH